MHFTHFTAAFFAVLAVAAPLPPARRDLIPAVPELGSGGVPETSNILGGGAPGQGLPGTGNLLGGGNTLPGAGSLPGAGGLLGGGKTLPGAGGVGNSLLGGALPGSSAGSRPLGEPNVPGAGNLEKALPVGELPNTLSDGPLENGLGFLSIKRDPEAVSGTAYAALVKRSAADGSATKIVARELPGVALRAGESIRSLM